MTIAILVSLHELLFMKPKNLLKRYGKKSWAVITGGSEGIGYGIAKELAKTGFNVILIARKKDKLIESCAEIEKEYAVQTKYFVTDFA